MATKDNKTNRESSEKKDASSKDKQPNAQSKKKGAQLEGMGLSGGDKSSKKKAAADGAKKTAEGAKKTAEGATQAASGAGRVAAGDLSGAKDAIQGAKKTLDGAQDVKKGMAQTKEAMAKDDGDDSKDGSSSSSNKKDKTALGSNKNSDMAGMKLLMSDDDDDSDSDNESGDSGGLSDKDKPDDTMKDLKNFAKTTAQGAGAGAAGTAYYGAMALIQWMKMMLAKGLMALTNIWASIVGLVANVASWLATVTGLSAVASMIVTIGSIATTAVTIAVTVVTVISSNIAVRDDIACVADKTSVADSVLDWQESGESSLMRTENITKAWSLFSEMGVNEMAAAGILGNFDFESGLDSTGVETIYDEPYAIGPKKAKAEAANFKMAVMDPAYKARFPGVDMGGIGLGQWSNGRNTTLRNYAKDRGLMWHDIGTQLAFMFDGDNKGDIDLLWNIANDPNLTIDSATQRFMAEWERPASLASLSGRQTSAAKLFLDLQTITVDTDYAQSIISGMNKDVAQSNNNKGSYAQDDGCGDTVGSHKGGQADGTGVFPAGVTGTMWSPASLPSELKAFTHNPEDVGMSYGSQTGWNVNNGNPGQCVAFSDAYMQALYGVPKPGGVDGGGVAEAWANKYKGSLGGALSKVPAAGAVFSYNNSGQYGHTGVVDHVFANGDILVVEQNITGYSGDNNGTPSTWSWRYFTKDIYEGKNTTSNSRDWKFYKPTKAPAWSKE